MSIDWNTFSPVRPTFIGTKAFYDHDLSEIATYIDWQPFFIAWELHGRFPQILTDEKVGVEATSFITTLRSCLKKLSQKSG
jgi:5-methyltetrahydrofolate--homocysteine methyltransferase